MYIQSTYSVQWLLMSIHVLHLDSWWWLEMDMAKQCSYLCYCMGTQNFH